jgi:hypothetical protein
MTVPEIPPMMLALLHRPPESATQVIVTNAKRSLLSAHIEFVTEAAIV